MPPAKSRKKAGAKPIATSARATRARSKEVAAPPPPAITASRRSTRATSNEPLLQLEDPNKILRRSRKTPEVQSQQAPDVQAPVEPPTPCIDEENELQQDAPSSPTPIVETKEEEPYQMSGGLGVSQGMDVDDEIEVEVVRQVEVISEVEVQQSSSPFEDLPELPRQPTPPQDLTKYPHRLSDIREETTSELAHFIYSPRLRLPLDVKQRELQQAAFHISIARQQQQQNAAPSTPTPSVQPRRQSTFLSPLAGRSPSTAATPFNVGGLGISFTGYHNIFDHLHNILAEQPPRVTEALQILDRARREHEHEAVQQAQSPHIPSSPPVMAARQASPTSNVFHTPSEEVKPAARGGLLSVLASPLRIIATPVTKLGRLLSRGAQTQPVQKTASASTFKAPSTPTANYSRYTQSSSTPSQSFLGGSVNGARASPRSHNNFDVTSSQQSTSVTATGTPSTLYLADGRPIPKEFRNWTGRMRTRLQNDMDLVRHWDMEVESGDRVLTTDQEAFKAKTLEKQAYLDHWRARQPGNRHRAETAAAAADTRTPNLHDTIPIAGRKRTADEVIQTTEEQDAPHSSPTPKSLLHHVDTPDSKRRRVFTPPGYGSPVPGDPNYRHVNQERETATANAAGSPEPSARTSNRGWSVTVPQDSDDEDEEMTAPPSSEHSVGRVFGLTDSFYEDSSSEDEDEDMTEKTTTPASTDALTAGDAATAQPISSMIPPTPKATATTPFTHKYTPAKPSGLRAVQNVPSSSPKGTSPVAIPAFAMSAVAPASAPPIVPASEITPPLSPELDTGFATDLGKAYAAQIAASGRFAHGSLSDPRYDFLDAQAAKIASDMSALWKPYLRHVNGLNN